MAKNKGLGRDFFSLVEDNMLETKAEAKTTIRISRITPRGDQPRKSFDENALQVLADSISEHGVIQPIVVREIGVLEDNYEIIAGERRFRASQLAGKTTIPAYILKADDEDTMEMALIENIQREDLNALEIALAYQQLIEQHNLSQEQLSKRIGKGRATIANFLRLLKLPAAIQVALKEKRIDMGHAKALLSLTSHSDQINLFHEIESNSYSVREVEEIVRRMKDGEEQKPAAQKKVADKKQDAAYHQLKKQLTNFFQTPVQMTCTAKGSGKISIKFRNEQELERIITIFDKLNH